MGKSTIYYFYGHFHHILQGMDPKRKNFGLDFDCKTMAGSNCHIYRFRKEFALPNTLLMGLRVMYHSPLIGL